MPLASKFHRSCRWADATRYDEQRAREVDDWGDVPGAPDQLSDVPTRCAFCQQFIPITFTDPVLLIGQPWQQLSQGYLFAAHLKCLNDYGNGLVDPLPRR